MRLGIDNSTKWSSWYKVIDNTLKNKPQIVRFILNHEQEIENRWLIVPYWDLLSKASLFLQSFASATLYAEGDMLSLSQSHHYEKQKITYIRPL